MRVLTLTLVLAAAAVAALARPAPAQATIHEIVASFCSGQHVQEPPGISDPAANTFLRPLIASGVLVGVTFDPTLGGVVIEWSERPNMKFAVGDGLVDTGVRLGGVPVFSPPLISDHPAFERCPNLVLH